MNLENKENTSLENVGNTKSLNPKALLAFEEEETKETEIDLVDMFFALFDKLHIIILCTLVGALLLNAFSYFFIRPTYQSTSKIYVVSASKDSVIDFSDINVGTSLTLDYEQLILSYPVLSKVSDSLSLNYTMKDLQSMIAIENPSATRILNITVTSTDPKEAMDIAKQVLLAMLMLILLSVLIPARAEEAVSPMIVSEMADSTEYPALEADIPVITSEGKSNVKIAGVKSKNKLVRYTIPETLLRADENFLALMVEAEKYIGYPYVYGGSKPSTGFDCSGFVCWVFRQSGVYDTGRLGAKGLYSLCTDVSRDEARPGDLVFFTKTMGADVKGITHVGIYVGNNMMLHAGDPVGFADLQSDKWAKKIYAFGRLPVQQGAQANE